MGNKTSSPKPGKGKTKSQHEIKAQQGQQSKQKSSSRSSTTNGNGRRPSLGQPQQSTQLPPQQPPQSQPAQPHPAPYNPEDDAPIEAAVEEIPDDEGLDNGPEVVNLTAEPVLVPLDDPSIVATVVTAETIYLSNVEKQHVERLVADGMTETDALQHILSRRENDTAPRGAVTAPTAAAVSGTANSNQPNNSQQVGAQMMYPNQSAGSSIPQSTGNLQPTMSMNMGTFGGPGNNSMSPQPPLQQQAMMQQSSPAPPNPMGMPNQSMYQNPNMMYGSNNPTMPPTQPQPIPPPSQSFYSPQPSPADYNNMPNQSMYDMSGNAMAMPPQGMMGQSMYDMNGMNNMNAMYPPQYPSQMPPQPTMGPGPPMQPPYGNSFYGTGPPVPPPTQPSPMYDPSTQGYYPPNYYGGSMGPPPMPPAPMPTQYPPNHPSSGIPYVPMAPARRETLSVR